MSGIHSVTPSIKVKPKNIYIIMIQNVLFYTIPVKNDDHLPQYVIPIYKFIRTVSKSLSDPQTAFGLLCHLLHLRRTLPDRIRDLHASQNPCQLIYRFIGI